MIGVSDNICLDKKGVNSSNNGMDEKISSNNFYAEE